MNEETLTADVSNKLEELGALVDNDLPKYIVKLILNQHPIERIRSDLSLFLDGLNVPFMKWLEDYLSDNGQQQSANSNETKNKLEIISASEIEDEILDFEEEPHDNEEQQINDQLDQQSSDDLKHEQNVQLNSSTESTNKRKLDELDEDESSKRLLNNDKEAVKVSQGVNVIKLSDNSHLNDIGLMRRKALQEKSRQAKTRPENSKAEKTYFNQQTTSNQVDDEQTDDDYVDLRDKLNSRKKNQTPAGGTEPTSDSNDEQRTDDDEKKERCKFWPFCKKEAECIYAHPTEQCKQFPSCKLGADKCLAIHPLCKFDLHCTKNDCPFLHIAKKQQLPLPTVQPHVMHVECKFYPNCYNPNCPFIHPKLCLYGSNCKNPVCTFKHLSAETPHNNNVAKPHQLKWTKSTSNSNNGGENATTTDTENQVIIKDENEQSDDQLNEIKYEPNDELNSTLEDYDDQMEINIKAE